MATSDINIDVPCHDERFLLKNQHRWFGGFERCAAPYASARLLAHLENRICDGVICACMFMCHLLVWANGAPAFKNVDCLAACRQRR